jgi:hypothetical protein
MNTQTLLALVIRHILTMAGGGIYGIGALTGDQAQQLAGAIAALLAVGWSIYQKRQSKKNE